jgi:hypothetical protein
VDEPTNKTVGCNQRHTLEYAYTTTATKPIDCDASAASYLGGIPLTNVKPDLQVESFTSGGLQVCALRVTGANVLLKSVRNLGTSSLPEEPR